MTQCSYPKISIITPSYNQGEFLEKTILSVLEQGYSNLEYIIIDGGSSDNSVEIIKKYEKFIFHWESGPDGGQVSAINKGLAMASGDWVGWQNSDDIYYPGFFHEASKLILENKKLDLIMANLNIIDADDNLIRDVKYVLPDYFSMLAEGMLLANQSCLWKKEIHQDLGFLDPKYSCAFDYDWFLKVFKYTDNVKLISKPYGAIRFHSATKTSLVAEVFAKEFQLILYGRSPTAFQIIYSKLKRTLKYLFMGEIGYIFRGITLRFSGYFSRLFA